MMTLVNQIKNKMSESPVLYRIIFLNVAVFLFINTSKLLIFLFRVNDTWLVWLVDQVSVPADMHKLIFQPWSIFTYMFVHIDVFHILFNMLILFWTGSLFREYLGNKKLLSTYVLGALIGAAFYILSYNVFPRFTDVLTFSSLIGASAGVLAILTAIATLLPDYQVQLFFFGLVRLKYIAIFSIFLYAFSIPYGNAGGNLAHLGGAFYGYVYIRQLQKGRDLGLWFNNLMDLFSLGSKNKSKMKVAFKRASNDDDYRNQAKSRQEKIDQILDKISQSGYDSLSKDEKEILFNASKNKS